jgi:uncharacterized protein (TIGR02246 family)
MTHRHRLFVFLSLMMPLLGISPSAWAGAAEEVAEVARQRTKAGQDNNLDAFMAFYADNAVVTASGTGLRIEGKGAIRAYTGDLWQTYPTRGTLGRHSATRVYGNDTVAIVNGYGEQRFADRNGQISTATVRTTITWVKIGGKWLVVDVHASRMP